MVGSISPRSRTLVNFTWTMFYHVSRHNKTGTVLASNVILGSNAFSLIWPYQFCLYWAKMKASEIKYNGFCLLGFIFYFFLLKNIMVLILSLDSNYCYLSWPDILRRPGLLLPAWQQSSGFLCLKAFFRCRQPCLYLTWERERERVSYTLKLYFQVLI